MEFQWDQVKADLNWKKHGVDFADAVGVFEDDLLVVIYTYRGENIRIISARPATRTERGNYNERRI
jgi:uncharacterized DUF497 family protein